MAEVEPLKPDLGPLPEPIGGPLPIAWREGAAHPPAKELEALRVWVLADGCRDNAEPFADAILLHLKAARDAANLSKLQPRRHIPRLLRRASLIERAQSNLDAAEVQLLNLASKRYVLGQMPCLLRHVQSHLIPSDPRRFEFERVAQRLGIIDPAHPSFPESQSVPTRDQKETIVEDERGTIVSVVRGASSAALREQLRVRSFRNVVVVTTFAMTVLGIIIAVIGWRSPTAVPICFAPNKPGRPWSFVPPGARRRS